MRNIIALLFLLLVGPASGKDWQDTMDDIGKDAREDRRHREQLREQRDRELMNQIEQADHNRKMEYRLDRIERQNGSIQIDIDDIRTKRR